MSQSPGLPPRPPGSDLSGPEHVSPACPPASSTQGNKPPWTVNLPPVNSSVAHPPPPSSSVVTSPDHIASLSPSATDRVFPIRSVVYVDPTPTTTPTPRPHSDYFHSYTRVGDARAPPDIRRQSLSSTASQSSHASHSSHRPYAPRTPAPKSHHTQEVTASNVDGERKDRRRRNSRIAPLILPSQVFNDTVSSCSGETGDPGEESRPPSVVHGRTSTPGAASSIRSFGSSVADYGHVTHRFTHVVTEGGHAIITGRDGDTLQRCEDEPIHIPGAIQGFGLLVALEDTGDHGVLPVRIVSENSKRLLGKSPPELFALDSFTDLLSEDQADNLIDHIDFIKDEETDVSLNGPEVFVLSFKTGPGRPKKMWCAMHQNEANPGLFICEFEMEDDQLYPLVPPNEHTPELPEDTLDCKPTPEELIESTEIKSRPLRILRSARKRKGEAAAMEVFNIMSQVQEQLAAASTLEVFLKVLVGIVKELTGFHRVMMYQFDQSFNGRVVTELVDPRATKDLYKGLHFPASDIPKQARDLYKINRVRMLYDRDLETARLVCRTAGDLETPLDLTHSYLRAMSPIHLKYLGNMAVRSSMSISIDAFGELWGLVACHSYGMRGMRVSFPIRKMCRLIGDSASRNIERLSYASRLQARKLINTVPTEANPSGYIIASSDDLLSLFNADYGILSIRDETKTFGQLSHSQEALAMLEYLRMRKIESVMASTDIRGDFPDLRYPPGFQVIAGMLIVPLSPGGSDFIVFFRKGQLKEVKWAGNPYEKFVKEGTEGYLEPRKSFKTWSEMVVGKSREWTEEEIETAAVLCLVYGKFIEVWRQKEAALQNSQLHRLLLANSAHEVRTPLNAIINYLEIALEGTLDSETRENLSRSHSASKSLIYVINDLLDLTKTEEGGPLIKGESFGLKETFKEATDMFVGDSKRKNLTYEVIEHEGLPEHCIGDQRRVRQAISNITANAIQNTIEGGVKVEIYVASWPSQQHVEIEVAVTDTGVGMAPSTLDRLFNDLEQIQAESGATFDDNGASNLGQKEATSNKTTLGLGLALVARIIRNMDGQLRVKSEEGKGSRFVLQFPFDLPDSDIPDNAPVTSAMGYVSPRPPETPGTLPMDGERTLVAPHLTRNSPDENGLSRKRSLDSIVSMKSRRSFRSQNSAKSAMSDIDKLIDAIQESPHTLERFKRSESSQSMRPTCKNNNLEEILPSSSPRLRSRSLEDVGSHHLSSSHQRTMEQSTPGEQNLTSPGLSIKALKMPDDFKSSSIDAHQQGHVLGEVPNGSDQNAASPQNLSPNNMRVLVAEDDPVNSRIITKRLQKLGHIVTLTINGEECATAFGEKSTEFDVVLMDMQMPIVDGLTSTKMIRSFEKTHPGRISPRAAFCGRIPIIAVSASLLERSRSTYIDAGFDAWILKPISFERLGCLLAAIVDSNVREECLYQPGHWENGGWFHSGSKSVLEVPTVPSPSKNAAERLPAPPRTGPQANSSKDVPQPADTETIDFGDADNALGGGKIGDVGVEEARPQDENKEKHLHYEGKKTEAEPGGEPPLPPMAES